MAFGLQGNLAVPIFISAMVSAGLAAALLHGEDSGSPTQWAIITLPTILTACYIFLLKHNRPPRYDLNFWELLLNGGDFNATRKKPMRHPIISVAREQIAAKRKIR